MTYMRKFGCGSEAIVHKSRHFLSDNGLIWDDKETNTQILFIYKIREISRQKKITKMCITLLIRRLTIF